MQGHYDGKTVTTDWNDPAPGGRQQAVARSGTGPPRRRRTPRLAEVVADTLRERILTGQLPDGSELPNQERLLDEFGVSKQAVRDGLRILELEGLITVRRGNVGGAVVHLPTHSGPAYSLGLVLQSRGVRLDELGRALAIMEPVCARLCAGRPDRHEGVVPALQAIHEEGEQHVADVPRFMEAMSRFHSTMVSSCGNEPIVVVAGAIEEVWLAQVREWGVQQLQAGHFPDLEYRRAGLKVHEELIALIDDGDEDAVARLAEGHFDANQFYTDRIRPEQEVRVSLLANLSEDSRAVRPS